MGAPVSANGQDGSNTTVRSEACSRKKIKNQGTPTRLIQLVTALLLAFFASKPRFLTEGLMVMLIVFAVCPASIARPRLTRKLARQLGRGFILRIEVISWAIAPSWGVGGRCGGQWLRCGEMRWR